MPGPVSPFISWQRQADLVTISIQRPDQQNALSSDMYADLRNCFRLASADPKVRVIVLRGSPGAFAVGGDLESFLQLLESGPAAFRANFEMMYGDPLPFRAMLECDKPIVSVVDGFCVAGGLYLALCSDIVIASTRSRFGIPEARVGLAETPAIKLLLPAIGMARTRYLLLTGQFIGAEVAERWGLITQALPEGDLDDAATKIITSLRACSPAAIAAYKSLLNDEIGHMSSKALIDIACGADGIEGLRAFREKRPPRWTGTPSENAGQDGKETAE
jgi:enoyl-CoA hydratase/carnithine racemase